MKISDPAKINLIPDMLKLGLLLLSSFFLLLSCSENNDAREFVDASQIAGEPILIPEDPPLVVDGPKAQLQESTVASLDSQKLENNATETLEGTVVQGKIRNNDQNASGLQEQQSLPPLPEGSHYKPVEFRDLTDFQYEVEWEKDGLEFDYPAFAQRVPKGLRELTNTKVAIEGFMIPTVVDENNEVKEFLLLPDQMSCCFGQTPEANGWVVVNAQEGVEVLMDRIIRVTGLLSVEERWDEEFFVGLYHLECKEITGPSL